MVSSLVLLGRQAKALDDPLPCQREDPQLWFSDLPADLELAKAYCQPCPIRRVCLSGAVERGEPHGVWGGEILTRGAIITEKGHAAGRPEETSVAKLMHPPDRPTGHRRQRGQKSGSGRRRGEG
jgi:WhiB family transcriptional regulator, redox-sensing transcriptional regulator